MISMGSLTNLPRLMTKYSPLFAQPSLENEIIKVKASNAYSFEWEKVIRVYNKANEKERKNMFAIANLNDFVSIHARDFMSLRHSIFFRPLFTYNAFDSANICYIINIL